VPDPFTCENSFKPSREPKTLNSSIDILPVVSDLKSIVTMSGVGIGYTRSSWLVQRGTRILKIIWLSSNGCRMPLVTYHSLPTLLLGSGFWSLKVSMTVDSPILQSIIKSEAIVAEPPPALRIEGLTGETVV
jgi:hypothetical protein